jgi:hypothetical protein
VQNLPKKEVMTMSDEQKTYQDVYNKRVRQEFAALENDPIAKAQADLDFHWQCRLRAEAALRDEAEWVEVGGFWERRRPSCHRSRKDSDWDLR